MGKHRLHDIRLLQWVRSIYRERKIWASERSRFLEEAKVKEQQGLFTHGNLNDYIQALDRHRVTFQEYMLSYEYWDIDEKKRSEFISKSQMQCIYRKMVEPEVRKMFGNKVEFLKTYAPFVQRRWLVADEASPEQFRDMVTTVDCIVKPQSGTCGVGIFKTTSSDLGDWKQLYETCAKEHMLVEECVRECHELEEFNPSSLNTIRVVTISYKDKCEILGALFRMGTRGNFVDNTHAGGIFAPINVENGTIERDGMDSHRNLYPVHPDSGKQIKGFVIPQWDEIVSQCRKAACHVPGIIFAGWDICVLPSGKVEFIEGNHAPDVDLGLQAPLKKGIKRDVQRLVNQVAGVDPLSFIPIASRTYNSRLW